MKKILVVLATVALTSGTFFNPTFYTKSAKSSTNQLGSCKATNESAGNICKKL